MSSSLIEKNTLTHISIFVFRFGSWLKCPPHHSLSLYSHAKHITYTHHTMLFGYRLWQYVTFELSFNFTYTILFDPHSTSKQDECYADRLTFLKSKYRESNLMKIASAETKHCLSSPMSSSSSPSSQKKWIDFNMISDCACYHLAEYLC